MERHICPNAINAQADVIGWYRTMLPRDGLQCTLYNLDDVLSLLDVKQHKWLEHHACTIFADFEVLNRKHELLFGEKSNLTKSIGSEFALI